MRSLEEEPRTVPSARTWPLRINAPALQEDAPARGVSTRISSYPKLLQTSPLATQQGVSGGDERQYILRTSRPATLAPASEGSERQVPG